ncbi:MAG TPA: class I SAM-dependent methyltransferase [Myxococcaceae bacterium]|nr:class I SAM-dependent methyltransferase [Myxococcaceae bacterium]
MTFCVHTPGAVDAEVREVQDWVQHVLPDSGRGLRVLEVGCGPGILAARLLEEQVLVTAIDVSEEQVRLARERGVPAIVSDFLSFEGGAFDALVFTRSLHHISPLAAGISKIRELIKPGGLILADEFAHDEIDAVTAAWFWDLQAVLEECGALAPDARGQHGHHGAHRSPPAAPSPDPLQRWRERHLHQPPLHGAAMLITALDAAFQLQLPERGPYLHRYFSERVDDSDAGSRLFLRLRELERLRLRQGLLVPVGLRVVAAASAPPRRRAAHRAPRRGRRQKTLKRRRS